MTLSSIPSFCWIAITVVLLSCGTEPEQLKKPVAKGGVQYGGVFHFQSPERPETFNPLAGTNLYTRNITYQIFETLLKPDPVTLRATPHLAKEIRVDESGRFYTLYLRRGIYFHPDPVFTNGPRELNAKDVKFSLELACSNLKINKLSHLLISKIKGAYTFFMNSRNSLPFSGISGIRVVDDSTVTIELLQPFYGFKELLAHPNLCMVAPEVYQTYKDDFDNHPVGTGPFVLKSYTDDQLELKKFDQYWKKDIHGNQLPYLDGIVVKFSTDKKSEIEGFALEKLDCVLDIPVDQINSLLGSLQEAQQGEVVPHKIVSEPSLSVMYIGFNCEAPPFDDWRVRKAFHLSVDRMKIVNEYLAGEGWPSNNGFIPPLDFYPNEDVKSFQLNVAEAQKLLKDAGYPNGKRFPKLDIWVNARAGTPNYNMTKGVVDAVNQSLNITLNLRECSIQERDKAIATGEALVWRAGWVADYPHPESFLSLFYSKNVRNVSINAFRYQNTQFDKMFEQANREENTLVRNQLYVMCDQMIVQEAVVLPIFTDDLIVLLNHRVRNFQINSLELLDFSSIFIKESR